MSDVHTTHCNQGEYVGGCKYGDDNCTAMKPVMPTDGRQFVSNRKEIIKFLRRSGTKAAVEVGFDGPYVFVEKGDLIDSVLTDKTGDYPDLSDYDGEVKHGWFADNVFHLPVGVN